MQVAHRDGDQSVRGLSTPKQSSGSVVGHASGCASVAPVRVLWAAMSGAVDVVVTEVPRLAGLDAFAASPAVDSAARYLRRPCCAGPVVVAVVSALLPCAASRLVFTLVRGASSGLVE